MARTTADSSTAPPSRQSTAPRQSSSHSSPQAHPPPPPPPPSAASAATTTTTTTTTAPTQSLPDPACNNCRVKKIKCDRKSPRCTSCRRNSLECNYSDKGKRVNQTSLVLSNLDVIQSRLGLIEGALSSVLANVEKPPMSLHSSSNSSNDGAEYMPETDDFDMLTTLNSKSTDEPQIPAACEWKDLMKLQSSCSIISFGLEAYFALAQRLADDFHLSVPSHVEAKERYSKYQDSIYQNLLQSLGSSEHLNFVQDGQMVALPPRALIDDACDTFFKEVNPLNPIFSRDSFQALVTQMYGTSAHVRDTASVICINNVILQTLSVKAKVANLNTATNSLNVGMMDLCSLLVKNVKRALTVTKDFVAPRLINVQALMTLCVIAQEYCQIGTAEITLGLACQVARMMGLNRRRKAPPGFTPEELEERSKVFWSLFLLDKQISFIGGNSCRLPYYDCDVPLPEEPDFRRFLLARIPLARIQEQTFFDLYSAQAHGRSLSESQFCSYKLQKSLDRWAKMHESIIGEPTSSAEPNSVASSYFRLSLNFDNHNTRILASRLCNADDVIKGRLDHARKGIRLMIKARSLTGTIGGSQLLRGLFHYAPFVEFFEIFKNVITYPLRSCSPAEDLSLLGSVVRILQVLSENSNLSTSHSSQLLLVASAHLDLATRFVEFVDRYNAPTEFSTRPSPRNSGDISPRSSQMLRNEIILQQFRSSFLGSGTGAMSEDENSMANDFTMNHTAMPPEAFTTKFDPSHNDRMVQSDYYNADSSMPGFESEAFNTLNAVDCNRPSVMIADPEMHGGMAVNDGTADLSMFTKDSTVDMFSSWKAFDKLWP